MELRVRDATGSNCVEYSRLDWYNRRAHTTTGKCYAKTKPATKVTSAYSRRAYERIAFVC